jgi:hypothetical protein
MSVASSMLNGRDKPRSVGALREAVLAGETMVVGGYTITPQLARGLDCASLDPWPFGESRVEWIDIGECLKEPSVAQSPTAAEALRLARAGIRTHVVPGRRFWSSPDVFEFEALINCSLRALDTGPCPT